MQRIQAMRHTSFYRNSLLFAALFAALMCASFKLDDNQDEQTIKALFIYNFTKHIEWPKDKSVDHFVIGVIGNTPVYDKLSEIVKDRKIKNRTAEIRRYNKTDKIMCHFFIGNFENDLKGGISIDRIPLFSVKYGIIFSVDGLLGGKQLECDLNKL